MNPTTTAPAPVDLKALPPYAPTPLTDFSKPEHKAAIEQALAAVRGRLGQEHPLVIGGERLKGEKTFESRNPARPAEVIGRFQSASTAQASHAVETAHRAFASWSRVPARERAAYLFEAARRMRDRKHLFSAWMVYEVGKSWAEADADTAEAIDFLEFYAREMLRYDSPPPLTQLPGEKGHLVYLPLGVGAVIPPWNFPLAICVGMCSAAIVTGNTVVVKPSSDSPAIAWQFFQLMEEVGLPAGVFNFVTGSGGTVGMLSATAVPVANTSRATWVAVAPASSAAWPTRGACPCAVTTATASSPSPTTTTIWATPLPPSRATPATHGTSTTTTCCAPTPRR